MVGSGRVLVALADLQRRYDGPIPAPLRRAAQFGALARLRLAEAENQANLFTTLIFDQLGAIRQRRALGRVPEELVRDLTVYRRQRRWWCREAARLRDTLRDAPP
jgi:hypothetical protein